jgi:hypothetical protein
VFQPFRTTINKITGKKQPCVPHPCLEVLEEGFTLEGIAKQNAETALIFCNQETKDIYIIFLL